MSERMDLGAVSAYAIAVENGFEGTEAEWLESLKGDTGAKGKSAYQIAVDNGYSGTESEWLASLKGEKGADGTSYDDTEIKADIKKAVVKYTGNVTDANNVPVNTVYTVLASRNISNLPVNENGTLFTLNAYAVDTTLRAQFFLTDSNKFYHRHSYGGEGKWVAWIRSGEYVEEIDTDTPLYDDYLKDSYTLNGKTAVFFGDSITYGYAGVGQRLEHPYPDVFCDNENMTGYNEGVSNSLFGVYGSNHRIIEQVTNSTHKNADIVFVAAGVNDWGFQTPIETFKTAVDEVIDYLLANYTATDIIFITPINANYSKAKGNIRLSQYQSIITERVIKKDTSRRLSVVQGYKFNFPCTKNSADYRNIMFIDGLHPTQHGINTAYITGLTSAIK